MSRYIRFIPMVAAAVLVTAFVSGDVAAKPLSNETFSTVSSPRIPESVTICSQKIDLDDMGHYERFDRELTSLIYTHGNTLLMIKRANRYFPQMAPILKANGIPEDLLYLACIESTLNPRAVSPAKAAGIWQFIPSTAKEYGLEVSDEVDERFNIDKATAAACRYFKKSLARFGGDWMAVMQAYNAGNARITSQLNAQLVDNPLDLYLAEETMRYPFRIIAAKVLMEHPAAFGFKISAEQLYQPRQVDVIEVNGPVESWAQWAKDHGIDYNTLRDENPWIRAPKLTNKTGKTYKVRVPKKGAMTRSKAARSVYNKNWIAND